MQTATERYLKAAEALNELCASQQRYPADDELHPLILHSRPAIKEQIAILERLDEELYSRNYPELPPPPWTPDREVSSALKVLDVYVKKEKLLPHSIVKVFSLVNKSIIDLVIQTGDKRESLWGE